MTPADSTQSENISRISTCRRSSSMINGLFIFTATAILFSMPISDGDAFWHIASGRWMAENLSLLWHDPFSYMTYNAQLSAAEELRVNIIFRQYWLAQLFMYSVWYMSGVAGIVLLRGICYGIIVLVIWHWTSGKAGQAMGWLLTLIIVPLLLCFPNERPQIVSFLFMPILLWCLETIYQQGKSLPKLALTAIPLIMIIWANMHGGFILGCCAIIVYICGLFMRDRAGNPLLLLVLGISLLLSACNPCGLDAFRSIITTTDITTSGNLEFLTPFRAARDLGYYFPTFWLALSWVAVTLFSKWKQLSFPTIIMICGLALLACSGLRYIPLFMLSLPLLAHRLPLPGRPSSGILAILLLPVLLFQIEWKSLLTFRENALYPKEAIKFIKINDVPDRIFNFYDWGGYIALQLPDRKVFIDGRALVDWQSTLYDQIITGDQWEKTFRHYGISSVIMPAVSPVTGETYPLLDLISSSPGWNIVHADKQAVIFVSVAPENMSLINKHPVARAEYYKHILAVTDSLPAPLHNRIPFLISQGNAHFQLGNYAAAQTMYDKALLREPDNQWVRIMLEQIRRRNN